MTQHSPLIAVVASFYEGGVYGLRNGYMQSVLDAGGTPFVVPLGAKPAALESLLEKADGVIISGGADVDPRYYGAAREAACGAAMPARDEADRVIVEHCLACKKPLLGICRGMQAINVFTGGTLVQDIGSHIATDIDHSQKEPYEVVTHRVKSTESAYFEALFGAPEIEVNSHHHQCVDKPGKDVKIIARACGDDVPEALVVTSMPFCLAVQWHPEMLSAARDDAAAVFKALTAACQGDFLPIPVTD